MENFHITSREITNRKELKNIKGGGGIGGTPAPPSGFPGGPLGRNYKCCSDITYSNCSECVNIDAGTSHCTGGNILVLC